MIFFVEILFFIVSFFKIRVFPYFPRECTLHHCFYTNFFYKKRAAVRLFLFRLRQTGIEIFFHVLLNHAEHMRAFTVK